MGIKIIFSSLDNKFIDTIGLQLQETRPHLPIVINMSFITINYLLYDTVMVLQHKALHVTILARELFFINLVIITPLIGIISAK